MPASPRSAPPTRRSRTGLVRGSALGLGLLVASTAVAPPALAEDEAAGGAPDSNPDPGQRTAPQPLVDVVAEAAPAVMALGADFGSGKDFELRLAPTGPVPGDLDLAGATFTLTNVHQRSVVGHCVVDSAGTCTVHEDRDEDRSGNEISLRSGIYQVEQTAGVPGLAPQKGVLGTLQLCQTAFCGDGTVEFTNASLFRRTVKATVVEQDAGTGVAGATYGLTGPNYPRRPVPQRDREPGGTGAVYDAGQQTSGGNGVARWTGGWFLPGTWTLQPGTPPAGFDAGTPATFPIVTTAGQARNDVAATTQVSLRRTPEPDPELHGSATLRVVPTGTAPADLDLSGAEFVLTDVEDPANTAVCVTDATGACSFEVTVPADAAGAAEADGAPNLPVGRYEVRQTTAVPGLAPAAELPVLELCVAADEEDCRVELEAPNASLFRTAVEAVLSDAGVAVPDAELTLVGPAYPALPLLVGEEAGTADGEVADLDVPDPAVQDSGAATTDVGGVARWTGFFLPGTWTFGAPGRQLVDAEHELEPVGEAEPGAWRVDLALVGDEEPEPEPEPNPQPDPQPDPQSNPQPQTPPQTPPQNPGTGGAPAAPDAGRGTGAGVPGPQDEGGDTAVEELPAEPSGTTGPSPRPGGPSLPAGGPTEGDPATPQLQTAAADDLLTAGLVTAIGTLFIGAVVFGFLWLRRRARQG